MVKVKFTWFLHDVEVGLMVLSRVSETLCW